MKTNLILFLTLFLGITVNSNGFSEEIPIPGTGDGVAVLKSVGEAFSGKTGINVRVPKSIGSGGGVKAAGNENVNLARVARKIKEKEKHFGLSYKAIFQIPTVFFVHNDISVDNLSSQNVLDIFSGKISNWKDVGGEDKAIFVIRREDGDSSLKNLHNTFPGFKDITITEKSRTVEKTPLMVANILNVKDSIGFGPLDVALENNIKVLKINGKSATDSGYPYYGTIGLVYKEKNLTGITKDFMDFATSPAAHGPIRKAGGIPME